MNRIILIGNGFDVAHDLETSYKQFIDDYWRRVCNLLFERLKQLDANRTSSRTFNDTKIYGISNHDSNIYFKNLPPTSEIEPFKNYKELEKQEDLISNLEFKNKFLEKITKNVSLKNWVDIEIEYYDSLKQIIIPDYQSKSDSNNNFKYESVTDLNKDFDKIKEYLIAYLHDVIKNRDINPFKNIHEIIYSYIKYQDFPEKIVTKKAEEEYKKLEEGRIEKSDLWDTKERLIKYLKVDKKGTVLNELPENILFLNFNYTTLEKKYYDEIENRYRLELVPIILDIIHIHGSFEQPDNYPFIFGYGDEMEENYQTIENSNENEYLENIKSIKYFETNNYKRLLGFINKGEYQVFLFGHSCGVSDKVLLNTLFEHENCVSIKPFYYKYKVKGTEIIKDNYSDIIRNISRHFNNKAVMRDKIVPKVYCEPLIKKIF